jgi:flavin reductase (DIM6/NTAB) family NADH-FMN oxidoreductase RutF
MGDTQAFKDVLSRFASGVTVVTTMCDGTPYGLTVSAFSSVSADPPRVLVCLGRETSSLPMFERSGCFAVHILGSEHVKLGMRFAKMLPDVTEPFDQLSYRREATGAPILDGCLAWLDCTVEASHEVGDHTVYYGAVEALGVAAEGKPLLYFDRTWRVLRDEPLTP